MAEYQVDNYGNQSSENRTNLIINYLPQYLTDNDLYKTFCPVGTIKSCRIMRDMKTGYSFGYGFIEYEKPEDAAKAIERLNNLPMLHKKIKVSYARPPSEDIKETNLYVQHIPRFYGEDELHVLFAPYGKIVQKNVLKDKITGVARGIGFVRYDKKSEAQEAINALNGQIPHNGTEPLVVRIAEDHGKMRNNQGYMRGGGNNGGMGNANRNGGGGYQNYDSAAAGAGFNHAGGPPPYVRGGFNNAGGKMQSGRFAKRFHPMGGWNGSYFAQPPGPSYGNF